jgi:hypothetical protein
MLDRRGSSRCSDRVVAIYDARSWLPHLLTIIVGDVDARYRLCADRRHPSLASPCARPRGRQQGSAALSRDHRSLRACAGRITEFRLMQPSHANYGGRSVRRIGGSRTDQARRRRQSRASNGSRLQLRPRRRSGRGTLREQPGFSGTLCRGKPDFDGLSFAFRSRSRSVIDAKEPSILRPPPASRAVRLRPDVRFRG